jgi:hypothetical protein
MKSASTATAVLVLVLLSFHFDQSQAQDPGVADTVRLASVSGQIYNTELDSFGTAAMPVFLFNDEELVSVVIPLLLDGYSGWLRYDSVSYVDSRLAQPAVLDHREAYLFGTDRFTVDSLLLSFSLSSGENLPVGSGKLCDVWFTLHFGGEVLVDSLSHSPQGGLLLTDSNQNSFSPQFSSGLIDIACNYLVGDVNEDGSLDIGDVITHHKMFFYDSPWWDYPIFERAGLFDLDCDRRLDMRDLMRLCHTVYETGPPPCTCATVNPPLYYDPGLPDTVWMAPETLIVGISSPVCIGVINDELLSGLALSFELVGTSSLEWDGQVESIWTDRMAQAFDLRIFHENSNGVNPDTFQLYAFQGDRSLPAGRDALCCPSFTPLSAGTANFALVGWVNGGESMLVTEDHAAVLPALYGGEIVVLAYLAGDANHDGTIGVADVIFLLNYLFRHGPAPNPLEAGDANCQGAVDFGDVVYLLNYLFRGGPPPCER